MPIIKANEPLGERPAIIVIYGDPGICKTSLGNTCESPLLLDFDRGVNRSFGRKDTLVPENWNEVLQEEVKGTYREFKTIIIDTAKAALDDFLMLHVVEQDYKLRTNKLGAYGAIGDAFKLFLNGRRSENADILIIAHAKKDEDTKRHIPDVTGQSYQLLMRIADQVGYVTMENGARTIRFEPSDVTVGKNVAGIDKMVVPDKADPAFRTFGADLFSKVRSAISAMSEEQREALERSAAYQASIAECENPSELTQLLSHVNELPEYLKLALRKAISDKAKEMKWVVDAEAKGFRYTARIAEPTFEALINGLGNCGNVEAIAELYHDHSEVIEADERLKDAFDNATATLSGQQDEPESTEKTADTTKQKTRKGREAVTNAA